MSVHELEVDGPQKLAEGIERYHFLDPTTSESVLWGERISRPDNKYAAVNWPPNYNLRKAVAGINQVYRMGGNLFLVPFGKTGSIEGYEFNRH